MKILRVTVAFSIALSLGATTAYLWENHQVKAIDMDKRILSLPMKVVCVGRFLVDVPEIATVTYRSASVSGWNILTIPETDEEFNLRIREKENLLTARRNERNGVSLESTRNVGGSEIAGKIFLFNRRWIPIMRAGKEVVSEVVAIDALVRSGGISYEFRADFRHPEQVEHLEKIIRQLRGLPVAHIPEEAGFCFDRGFIRDPLTAEQNESVSIFLGIKEYPDLAVSLSSTAGIDHNKTLLQRHSDSDIQKEYSSQFHPLRIGARSLNGITGEEVLQRVDELNGVKLHGFMWESIGNKTDVYLPSLSLELDTGLGRPGKPVNSSLSDAEAMALWEKISSSLRRRSVR